MHATQSSTGTARRRMFPILFFSNSLRSVVSYDSHGKTIILPYVFTTDNWSWEIQLGNVFSRPDAFLEIRSSPVGDFGFPLTFGQTDQNKPQSVLIWAKIVDEQPLNSVGADAVSWWETFELPILPCGQLPRLTWPDGPQVDIAKRLILADWFSIFKISDFWKKT